MLRRWVAVDLQPHFPWRRYLPALLVAATALLLAASGTLWWTRRLAREVRARRRADEQLDDIGRTMPGVAFRYVLNADGSMRRTFYSSGVGVFLGFKPEPGQMLHDALGHRTEAAYRDAARRMAASSLATGEPFKSTYPYRHPDGRDLWLSTQAVCSHNSEGQMVWTGYVVDISAERALQERVQREAAERHVLLASASHELRAPTHTLSLALQAIPPDGVPPASVRSLRIARDAARTLGQLLDDVLDAARFQAQAETLELRPQDFDLHGLIEQVRDAHAGPAAAKGLAFSCVVAPDVPRMAYVDPLRLKQVLTNLLSNAVKYTEQGRVDLGVALGLAPASAARPEPVPALVFTIEDTGPGIATALHERLFEPFGSAPVERGSTGLGLSICRRLTALMGGTIQLEDRPGGGTRVLVNLPGAWRSRQGLPLRREGRVLVCDDDPVCRILLAEALRRKGYPVVEVEDGQAALQRWRAGDVRLLITDLTMAGLSGGDLIAAIRQAEAEQAGQAGQAERTAIIVCSGDLTPSAAATGTAPRHDGFLSKPLDLATLDDMLVALGLQAESSVTS
jgi:two-component system sensor histidine kinase EvgS